MLDITMVFGPSKVPYTLKMRAQTCRIPCCLQAMRLICPAQSLAMPYQFSGNAGV